jgi:hypothetical protein
MNQHWHAGFLPGETHRAILPVHVLTWQSMKAPFNSEPYSSSKVIHQRRSTLGKVCAPTMVNNFAPRGTHIVGNFAFGTAGPTVTPFRDDEYSDPVGLTTQARLSLSGRRLGPKRILKMPMCNVSPIRTSPVPSLRGCLTPTKGRL